MKIFGRKNEHQSDHSDVPGEMERSQQSYSGSTRGEMNRGANVNMSNTLQEQDEPLKNNDRGGSRNGSEFR